MLTGNIDQRGKTARLVLGAFIEAIGLLLGVLWFMELTPAWTMWSAGVVWIVGIMVIIEALIGWCALRALGVKTPV